MKEILEAAGKSFFRELSEHTFKKATESLVTEGVKAAVDVWKRRRIRADEYEFAEWKKERAKAEKEAGGGDDEPEDAEASEAPEKGSDETETA